MLPSAEPGDNVGVNIRGIGKKDVARGDVICDAGSPAKVVEEFIGQIAVISSWGNCSWLHASIPRSHSTSPLQIC